MDFQSIALPTELQSRVGCKYTAIGVPESTLISACRHLSSRIIFDT
jgi:hypothetical protein